MRWLRSALVLTSLLASARADAQSNARVSKIAPPGTYEHPLGPSDSWSDRPEAPYLEGPRWSAPAAAKMPPPILDAYVDTKADPIVRWTLTMRPRLTQAASAAFTVEARTSIAIDGREIATASSRGVLTIEVPAGEHEVVVRGNVLTHRLTHITEEGFLAIAPLDTRHLLFATPSIVDAATIQIVVPTDAVEPDSPLSKAPISARATIRVPESWFVDDATSRPLLPCVAHGYSESTYRCEPKGQSAIESGWRTLSTEAATHEPSFRIGAQVRSPLHRPAVLNGGPLIGIGGELGEGFRMRFGYEIAFLGSGTTKRHIFTSASVDTDFDRRAVGALLFKGVTTLGLLGLGGGVPVRLAPEIATGLRLEGDVFLGPIGFIATGDLWLFAPERVHLTGTLLGAISF